MPWHILAPILPTYVLTFFWHGKLSCVRRTYVIIILPDALVYLHLYSNCTYNLYARPDVIMTRAVLAPILPTYVLTFFWHGKISCVRCTYVIIILFDTLVYLHIFSVRTSWHSSDVVTYHTSGVRTSLWFCLMYRRTYTYIPYVRNHASGVCTSL